MVAHGLTVGSFRITSVTNPLHDVQQPVRTAALWALGLNCFFGSDAPWKRKLFKIAITDDGRPALFGCFFFEPLRCPDRRLPGRAGSFGGRKMVEANGIEPMTSCLQSTRSPN
jgi:hypothetical protein